VFGSEQRDLLPLAKLLMGLSRGCELCCILSELTEPTRPKLSLS
jgi:hypothetical protein